QFLIFLSASALSFAFSDVKTWCPQTAVPDGYAVISNNTSSSVCTPGSYTNLYTIAKPDEDGTSQAICLELNTKIPPGFIITHHPSASIGSPCKTQSGGQGTTITIRKIQPSDDLVYACEYAFTRYNFHEISGFVVTDFVTRSDCNGNSYKAYQLSRVPTYPAP